MIVRYTAVNITKTLQSELEEYFISCDKVICLRADYTNNMIKVGNNMKINLLSCFLICLFFYLLTCFVLSMYVLSFIHTLQLVVTDALKEPDIRKIMTKVKNIITTFKTASLYHLYKFLFCRNLSYY